MKSSRRALKVPLYAWTLKSLESEARRFNTTATEIAVVILERRRIAPNGKFLPKGRNAPILVANRPRIMQISKSRKQLQTLGFKPGKTNLKQRQDTREAVRAGKSTNPFCKGEENRLNHV